MSIWRRFDHGFPTLLTTNVEGRRPVFRNPTAAQHLTRVLHQVQHEEGFDLVAHVIMPDHLHLIAWLPPELSPGRVMKMIKGRFAREHQAPSTRRGAFWQSRYHEKALTTEEALWAAVEYVRQNPVAAGLVKDAADYPWSSAGFPLRPPSG